MSLLANKKVRDAKLLVIILLTANCLVYPLSDCKANVDGQSSIIMTTEAPFKIEPGVIMSEGVQDGSALIEKMVEAAAKLSAYSADYKMKVFKNNKVSSEEGTFYFSKPKLLKLQVREGARKGSVAILASDGKIHGHLGGVLKFFSGTVSADSNMAKTINNYPMSDTDFFSLASYLKNMLKEGNASLATSEAKKTNKVSVPTLILDMCSTNKADKAKLLKRIYVDQKTFLPVYWEDYINGKIWTESSWANERFNLRLPDDFFRP